MIRVAPLDKGNYLRSFIPISIMALGSLFAGCDGTPPPPEPETSANAPAFDPVRFDEGLLAIETWLEDGRPEEAERIARRLVELDPDSTDALEAHGRCLMIAAAMVRRDGRGDGIKEEEEALERYRALIAFSGATPLPAHLHAAGLAAQACGEFEEALALHVRADTLEPTNPQHAIFAGNIHSRLGAPAEARIWFTRATEIDPREPWGWAGLAECHRQEDDWAPAIEAIRSARERSPLNTGFRVAEARILRESGRPREAAMLLFAIPDAQRATPAITRELTSACTLIGEHRRAAEAWGELHRRQPDDHDSALSAAKAWLNAGEPEQALAWLNVAETAGANPETIDAFRSRLPEANQRR